MGKKKRKKQAAADHSQLVKGGVVCAAVLGVVYFFSTLGGGGSAPSSNLTLVMPQDQARHGGQVRANVAPGVPERVEQSRQNRAAPAAAEEAASPTDASLMLKEDIDLIKEQFDQKEMADIPAEPGTIIPEEMLQIEIPRSPLELPELIERIKPSLVKLTLFHSAGSRTGTGFVVSRSGLVVTSLHSLEGVRSAAAEFFDGSSAAVEGCRLVNYQLGIALLQIQAPEEGLSLLPLVDRVPEKEMRVVGFGAGSPIAVEGEIRAVFSSHEQQSGLQIPLIGQWVETSIPAGPGFRGGPVTNRFGEVVAVNLLQITNGEEQNLALSAREVLQLLHASRSQPVVKLSPDLYTGLNVELKKRMARDITTTERATELFAEIKQIEISHDFENLSSYPVIMADLINRSVKRSFSQAGFEVVIGASGGKAPTLLVTLSGEPQRGRAKESLKVSVRSQLVAIDPMENSSNQFVIVWKGKQSELGTVLAEGVSPEIVSRILGPKLKSYFSKLRTAHSKAKRQLSQKNGKK